MKLFALLCVIGFAAAGSSYYPSGSMGPGGAIGSGRIGWRPDTTYRFAYEGRMLTGIPELASHYSGLGINCTVDVHVRADYGFVLKISDAKFVRVNQFLAVGGSSQREKNWRGVPLPGFEPVPQQQRQHLEEPTLFQLSKGGEFETMVVGGDEPEWSVNFKKALVVLFQTKFEMYLPDIEGNGMTPNGEDSTGIPPITSFWRTQESSTDGICNVEYELNRLPEEMVNQRPDLFPLKQQCQKVQGGQGEFYELVKTKDVSSCERRTAYSGYKPGYFRCPTGNCDGMWARSSITRYYACGSRRNQGPSPISGGSGYQIPDLQIQKIVNEGELQQELLGFKTEKFLTGVRQVLRLESENPGPSGAIRGIHVGGPAGGKTVESLGFEYKGKKSGGEHVLSQAGLESGSGGSGFSKVGGAPGDKLRPDEIVRQVQKLLQEIVQEDLKQTGQDTAKKQVTMKVLSVARGLSLLARPQLQQVYSQGKQQQQSQEDRKSFENIFWDCLIMGGTYENVLFAKEKIENGEVSKTQAIVIFTMLPNYIMTPTRGLLESIYTLIRSQKVEQQKGIFGPAVLGFSTLLQRSCLDENREDSYPTHVFGNFCTPHSEILTSKWIPYLTNKLQEQGQQESPETKNTIIVGLGLLSHKQILPAILPFVEGYQRVSPQSEESSPVNRLGRFLAVGALKNVGYYHKHIVLPVLSNVFVNRAEAVEIRALALNLILSLEPPMTILHKIAASTWAEKEPRILDQVNTAFFSLAQMRSSEVDPAWSKKAELAQRVYLVYPLIKKSPNRFPASGTYYFSDYLPQIGAGYRGLTAWLADRSQDVAPADIYSKVVYYLNRYQFTPVEMGIRTRNAGNMLKQIAGLLSGEETEGGEGYEGQMHSELRGIFEKLNPKGPEGGNAFATSVYFRLFENIHIYKDLHSESVAQLQEKIGKALNGGNLESIKRKILDGEEMAVQRVVNLSPIEMSIPSEMGFPIFIELHMPVVASVRGSVKVRPSLSQPKAEGSLKTVLAAQMIGWVGTRCPFTQEYVVTGIDQHAVLDMPGKVDITIDVESLKANMEISALNGGSQSGNKLDLLHYHVRPYTVRKSVKDLTPMTLSQNIKFINTPNAQAQKGQTGQKNPMNVRSFSVGDYLGLDLHLVYKTQAPFVDFPALIEKFRQIRYNPINAARFFWAPQALSEQGKPSLRLHEVQLQYQPQSSSTKSVVIEIDLKTAAKKEGESGLRFTTVEREDRPGKWSPYKLEGKKASPSTDGEKKIEKCFGKIGGPSDLKYGQGASIRASVTLKGSSRPRTYSYSATIASGMTSFVQKWHLQLEKSGSSSGSGSNVNKVCINGKLVFPRNANELTSTAGVEKVRGEHISFDYENEIGFGQSSCGESKVTVQGKTETSQKQKEWSRESPEAKTLRKMEEQRVPLREVSKTAKKVREQATTLDKVDFVVKYTNFPKEYLYIPNGAVEYIKAAWTPYRQMNVTFTPQPISGSGNGYGYGDEKVNFESEFKVRFNQQSQSFNLTMVRPTETAVFRHIEVGTPLSYVLPLTARKAGEVLSEGAVSAIGPVVATGECTISGNYMKNFQEKNVTSEIGQNWVMVAGTCHGHGGTGNAVMVRNETNSRDSRKFAKVYLGDDDLSCSYGSGEVVLYANGKRQRLTSEPKPIYGDGGRVICHVRSSPDRQTLYVDGRASYGVQLRYIQGKTIIIDEETGERGLCGICANRTPRRCYVESAKQLAKSYQTENPVEPETCAKKRPGPTRGVSGGVSGIVGPCSKHAHVVSYGARGGSETCISQRPVLSCGEGKCKAGPGGRVGKKVGFVCMRSGSRTAERLAEKARAGQLLPELQHMPVSEEVEMRIPRTCVPIKSGYGY